MSVNIPASYEVAVVATIDPDVTTASTVVSDYVDMATFKKILAALSVGTMTATGTVDAKLVQATDSSGTSAKDISGKAITQMVAATDSDKQVLINCRDDELDINNDFTHVALSVTVATAASDLGALILGFVALDEPASGHDLASVAEIVL